MIELTLSNSKVKTWRRCPKQFEFKYEMKLRPKRKGVQLERGSWLHDLLMHHYDGHDWRERHNELKRQFDNLFEEEKEHLGDLPDEVERLMRGYLHEYRKIDGAFRTIDTELDEIITLPNGLKFNFIIDRIYEDRDGGLWLQDHKSVKNFMDPDFMLLDAQLARYFWCAERMGYTPLLGIEFNEFRTKAPTVPKLTDSGARLQKKMNIDTDALTYLREIKRHGFDPADYSDILSHLLHQHEKFFRRTKLPMSKPLMRQQMLELVMSAREITSAQKRGEFPRSPMKACDWDCDYKNLCITDLQGGNIAPLVKLHFKKSSRREEAA